MTKGLIAVMDWQRDDTIYIGSNKMMRNMYVRNTEYGNKMSEDLSRDFCLHFLGEKTAGRRYDPST
jgi:HKD family nuclease